MAELGAGAAGLAAGMDIKDDITVIHLKPAE